MASVSQLFASFGCNIEKVTVTRGRDPGIARLKLAAVIEDERMDMMVGRIRSLHHVLQVTPEQSRADKRAYWTVIYSLFVTVMGINIVSPLYGVYKEQLNLTSGMITLIFAVCPFLVIPSIVCFGQLCDRIGPKKILIAGIIAAMSGSVCFAFADSLSALLLARALQGISSGMINGAAVAALNGLRGVRDRHKAGYAAAIAVTAGNALGPVLSGTLAEFAPISTKTSILAHSLLSLPGLVGLLFFVMRSETAHSRRLHWPAVPTGIRAVFVTASMTSFITWGVISMYMSIIPSSMNEWIGRSSFFISGVSAALAHGVSAVSQLMFRSVSPLRTVIAGFTFLFLGLWAMAGTLAFHSIGLLLVSTVCVGLGHGPLYAASLAAVNMRAPDKSRSDMVSLFYVMTYMGVALPVLGLGFMAQWTGLPAANAVFVGVMECLIVIGAVCWIKLYRRN
ncbi:MFS transporter [Paenibacillus elgii]|uniref:MFS transporter n=1 Tax=Paenibacillus elgii TaxID=189691 RepID=UPI000248C696